MLVTVDVRAGARQEVVLESDNGYMVYTRVPPEKGKANARVIELLADHLSVPKSAISIHSGTRFKRKIISIDDSVL